MGTRSVVLYVLALVVVVVGVDILFLRHHTLARLITNIAIVVVFAVMYLAFFKRR
jgi:energy-converting hydrogenase Eha subunit E